MAEGVVNQRFGRIVCDDEIEDEIVATLTAWTVPYLAEIERQRGWAARSLEAPRSIISATLLERQPEDALPCLAVTVERVSSGRTPQDRAVGMDWRVVVEAVAVGADEHDVRRRVRAYVAAARAVMLRHAAGGGLVSHVQLVTTEYSATFGQKGRRLAAGAIELRCAVDGMVQQHAGRMRTPPVDPYAVPAGLGTVESVQVSVEAKNA